MPDFPEHETPRNSDPALAPLVSPGESKSRRLLLVGVAAACVLGLGVGLLAKPDLGGARDRSVKPAAAAAPASDGQVQIMVSTRAAPPVVATGGKLETMSSPPLVETLPSQPRVTRARAENDGPRSERRNWWDRLFGRGGPAPEPAPPPRVAPPPQAAPAPAPEPAMEVERVGRDRYDEPEFEPAPEPVRVRASPSFNCRYARSRSEQMICGDPGLADADRRLARAYQRAIRDGYPEGELRREQDGWLRARERAAMVHPDAVAEVYEQRIAELEEAAY